MPVKQLLLFVGLSLVFLSASCDPDSPVCIDCETDPEDREIQGPSTPTDYTLEVPDYLPRPIVDESNPLTVEGIELGRRLFYDPIMGRDSSFACADCHKQELAFT
ncbi:MAG: cytochrome c peroxidase, partial [Bacteroidota bacterium]